jgi:hypothetical protein
VTAVPETLHKDADREELHGADLDRPQVSNAQVYIRSESSDFGEDLQLVLFAVETLDCLDALYRVRNVLESQVQLVRLLVCAD